MFKLRWSGLCEGEGLLWQLEQHLGCQTRGSRFASSIHYAAYSESLRTFLFGVRLSNCTSDHFAMAPRVVFLCRQWKLVMLLGENVFLEIEEPTRHTK